MIVRRSNGWYVISEKTGKNLGGPYNSRPEAVHRLQQVEYFKHKGKQASWKDKLVGLLMGSAALTASLKAPELPKVILSAGDSTKVFLKGLGFKAQQKGLDPELVRKMVSVEAGKYPHRLVNPLQLKDRYFVPPKNFELLHPKDQQKVYVDQALQHMRDIFDRHSNKSLLYQIQAYNGLGKLPSDKYLAAYKDYLPKTFKAKKIDMKRYKPYAKKVLAQE